MENNKMREIKWKSGRKKKKVEGNKRKWKK